MINLQNQMLQERPKKKKTNPKQCLQLAFLLILTMSVFSIVFLTKFDRCLDL